MRRSTAFTLAMLIVVFFTTGWIFLTLISQRFSSGEIYPHYSSMRTDPLGAKALYESLDNTHAWECERNYKSLEKLEGASDQTLMLLHVSADTFSNGNKFDGRSVLKFAAGGGRVVITIDGQSSTWNEIEMRAEERREENRIKKEKEKKQSRKKTGEKKDLNKKQQDIEDKSEFDLDDETSLDEALGIFVQPRNFVMTPKGSYTLETSKELTLATNELPAWYSKTALVFEKTNNTKPGDVEEKKDDKKTVATTLLRPNMKDKWKVLATVKDDIMLAERRVSRGSIVVVTDSFFASNEALLKEPASVFLAWLVGNARHVIFDETHLGTSENPGIMTLALRYHLQGFFFAGLFLFALYVWQSSTSLVPPNDEIDQASNHVSGHGATAGLVSLLRRGVPLAQVLRKGFETFEKGNSRTSNAMLKKMEQARALLPPDDKKRLPVGAAAELYQRISDTLHPKRN